MNCLDTFWLGASDSNKVKLGLLNKLRTIKWIEDSTLAFLLSTIVHAKIWPMLAINMKHQVPYVLRCEQTHPEDHKIAGFMHSGPLCLICCPSWGCIRSGDLLDPLLSGELVLDCSRVGVWQCPIDGGCWRWHRLWWRIEQKRKTVEQVDEEFFFSENLEAVYSLGW